MHTEVQQILRRQLLDCEHRCLIPDLAAPVLEPARLGRPPDIVELIHVFGSISFTDAADHCCVSRILVSHIPLIAPPRDCETRFESLLFSCLVNYPKWSACCCYEQILSSESSIFLNDPLRVGCCRTCQCPQCLEATRPRLHPRMQA